MVELDAQNLPRKFLRENSNAFSIRKTCKFHPKQTKVVCVNQFHYGPYGSLYDYVIHVALIATLCVSLTVSSKPPLVIPCQHLLVSSTSSAENQLAAYSWCQAYTCMYVQLTEDHFIEGGHLSPPFHQPEEA